jgi:hypothetical protein
VSLAARVCGRALIVERCVGEECWRWAVLSELGHEVECGTAPDANTAERLAEEAALYIHPQSSGDNLAGRFV